MLSADLGYVLVLHSNDLFRKFTVRPVVVLGRRRTDDLDVDAHRVHVGQSLFDIGELWECVRQHHRVVVCHRCRSHRLQQHRGFLLFLRVLGDQRFRSQGQQVTVDVDRRRTLFCAASRGFDRRFHW